jgi:hypothetical protein
MSERLLISDMQDLRRFAPSHRIINHPRSLKNRVKRMIFISAHFFLSSIITDQALTPIFGASGKMVSAAIVQGTWRTD